MSFIKNRKAGLVIYNLAFLFLFLCIAEIILRIAGIGYDNAAFEPDQVLHHVHRKNYSFINDNPSEKEYSHIKVFYDEWGCVSDPSNKEQKLSERNRIALIGDSYIEGLQVPFDSSVTGLLQKNNRNKFEIKNFAVGGYSPVIYYLQLQKVITSYHPQKIILFLYGNDVREDKEYLNKATYNENKLTGIDGGMQPARYAIIRNSYLIRLVRKFYMQAVFYFRNESAEYIVKNTIEEKPVLTSPTTFYLDSIINLCSRNNCSLYLSAVPSKYKIVHGLAHDSTDFAVQCKQWTGLRNIPFIDLLPLFKKWFADTKQSPYFEKDIHFNIHGHSLVANAIEKVINE